MNTFLCLSKTFNNLHETYEYNISSILTINKKSINKSDINNGDLIFDANGNIGIITNVLDYKCNIFVVSNTNNQLNNSSKNFITRV